MTPSARVDRIVTKPRVLFIILMFLSRPCLAQTKVKPELGNGFTDPMVKAKLDSAIILVENVVNSVEFGKLVTSKKYVRRRHKSGPEILDLIRRGHEVGSQDDNVINLNRYLYWCDTRSRKLLLLF